MRLFEISRPSIAQVIAKFKEEHAEDIALGCERDYCSEPVALLNWFGARYGYKINKVHGGFKVDKALYDKEDFSRC